MIELKVTVIKKKSQSVIMFNQKDSRQKLF